MSQCITANPTSLPAESLETADDFVYTVRVDSTVPTIRINFTPPRTESAVGSVDNVSVSPPGPDHGTDWVEFTTSHLGTTYTVQVTYTAPARLDERDKVPPLETPTKSPKFRPHTTCPTS